MQGKEGEILWGLIVHLFILAFCLLLKGILRCSADWRYVQWGVASWVTRWAVALVHFWM